MVRKGLMIKMLAAGALLAGVVQAGLVSSVDPMADHKWATWQGLGTSDGIINDGVKWKVNGVATTTTEFNVGDVVVFEFDMYKRQWGNHSYDAMRVWFDDEFKTGYDNEDLLVLKNKFGEIDSTYKFNRNLPGFDARFATGSGNVTANVHKSFYSTVTFTNAGVYDLRARVTCSDDIMGPGQNPAPQVPTNFWNSFNSFDPAGDDRYDWIRQGEVEDFRFTVRTQNVPEPSLLTLLGCGLLGLLFVRRRGSK